MYCDRCGALIQEGQRYCSSCGKSLEPAPAVAAPAGARLSSHLRALGILWIVYSVLHLLPPLGLMMFGGMGQFPGLHHVHLPLALGPFLALLGGLLAIAAVIGIIAGWGLLDRRPWARMLAIVLGCFALFNIPFGTALGIYTLWLLLPQESEQQYRRMAGV